jgi:biopolymer transport protein ExbB
MDLTKLFLAFSLIGGKGMLYLLLILSVVSITIIIERFLYFRGNRPKHADFEQQFLSLIRRQKRDEALWLASTEAGPEARCAKAVLSVSKEGLEAMEEALSRQVANEQIAMEKRLLVLGTLGNNAPFVGLLGTVLGIIKAFHDLSVTGVGGPQVVMLGIAEALIATALGLFVAIPAVIAYNFFQKQTQRTRQRLDRFSVNSMVYIKQLVGASYVVPE